MLSSGWLCITRWKDGIGGTVYPFRKKKSVRFLFNRLAKNNPGWVTISDLLSAWRGVYVCVGKERQKTSAVMRFTCHRCLRIDKWRLENMTSPKQIFQPMSFFLVDRLQAASVFVICYKIYFFLNTQHFVTSSVHSDSCFCNSSTVRKVFFLLDLVFFFRIDSWWGSSSMTAKMENSSSSFFF